MTDQAVQIPADALGTCRSCRAPVLWVKSVRGHLMPLDREEMIGAGLLLFQIDAGGIARQAPKGQSGHQSHFTTCPQRAEWRKQR